MSSPTSQCLRTVVSEESDIAEKINLLNMRVFPEIVKDFNTGDASDRVTRLTRDIEPVPDHSRNVTETRTRVGLLLEFNLGIVIEEYLPEGHVVSYGASQAHTDLVLRGADRKPTVRLEVKAIEDIAEEKAASYEDMVHSIDPQRDILSIFTWGWRPSNKKGTETRVPQLDDLRAFEMREVSMARDLFWAQSQRSNNRNMIDVSMPVIQKESGILKEEEGNMGKLTRIVNSSDLENYSELQSQLNFGELQRYIDYMSFCKGKGINRAAEHYMDKFSYSYTPRSDPLHYSQADCQFVNYGEKENNLPLLVFSGGSSIVYNGELVTPIEERAHAVMSDHGLPEVQLLIIDNSEFNWTLATASATDSGVVDSLSTVIEQRGSNLFGDKIGRTPI